jgi:hypothetical protein
MNLRLYSNEPCGRPSEGRARTLPLQKRQFNLSFRARFSARRRAIARGDLALKMALESDGHEWQVTRTCALPDWRIFDVSFRARSALELVGQSFRICAWRRRVPNVEFYGAEEGVAAPLRCYSEMTNHNA